MGSFKLGKMTLGSACSRSPRPSSTPRRAKLRLRGPQGARRQRHRRVHPVRHLREALPDACDRGGQEGAHMGDQPLPVRAVRLMRARTPQVVPDDGYRRHAARSPDLDRCLRGAGASQGVTGFDGVARFAPRLWFPNGENCANLLQSCEAASPNWYNTQDRFIHDRVLWGPVFAYGIRSVGARSR